MESIAADEMVIEYVGQVNEFFTLVRYKSHFLLFVRLCVLYWQIYEKLSTKLLELDPRTYFALIWSTSLTQQSAVIWPVLSTTLAM